MRRLWSTDELVERWSLIPEDFTLLVGRIDASKLGLAAQLAYWRCHAGFPDEEADLAPAVIAHLARQIGVPIDALDGYDWSGRTGRRHRQAILDYLTIAAFDDEAEADLRNWLADELLPREPSAAVLEDEIGAWFARGRIVRPGAYRLDRIVRSARARGRRGGRKFALTKAQVRLAQAAMTNRDTSVSELCAELGVKPVTLYRYVGPNGELRDHGRSVLAA